MNDEDTFIQDIHKDGCITYPSEQMGLEDYPDILVLTPSRTFYWMCFNLTGGKLSEEKRDNFKLLKGKGHSVYTVKKLDIALFYHEFEMKRNKLV